MRPYEKLLVVAVTTVPLVAVLLGAPLMTPDTGDLNRNPLPFPEVSVTDVLDPGTYQAVGAWLGDRVPFRRRVRALDTKIDRGVFHDIDNAMILQGRDGWLFFEPAVGLGLMPEFDPADVRAGILRLKGEVEAAGKKFLFAFGPHKPTIYPQYLNGRDMRRQLRVRERLETFRDLMRREPVDGFIDGWDALEAAAATAPEPLYYPRDTHWTPLGAVELTKRVIETLDPTLVTSLVEKRGKPRRYNPDLVKFAGLEQRETIHVWDFIRKGVRWKKEAVEVGAKTRTKQFSATSRRKAPLLPRIVVISDSYGTSMHPSLRVFFKNTTFIHMKSSDTELARRALAEADIVLFLRVERFLWPMTEQAPFAEDSEEVLRLLSTLRAHADLNRRHSLTGSPPAASGSTVTAAAATRNNGAAYREPVRRSPTTSLTQNL